MTARFRFGIGPFRFSYRLTRTQAQKRAVARQLAAGRAAREARRFDPREHITVTETATSVEITVDPRGLSPRQQNLVLALAQKLEAEHSGTPVQMPPKGAATDWAAKQHAGLIAEIVAMKDEQAQADALAAIEDPVVQSAAIVAVLQDAADHAGDTG